MVSPAIPSRVELNAKLKTLAHFTVQSDSGDDGTSLVGKAAKDGSRNAGGSRHELDHAVPLPVSWTRKGDMNIAPPSSIVDPDATGRSHFIGHAAIAAVR